MLLALVRAVEAAAVAAARTMGRGDRKHSDQVAAEALRAQLGGLEIDGVVVIGEGPRDAAPVLYAGEALGRGGLPVDLAVDALEGTQLCAIGSANAIAALAAAERGGLLGIPDLYMEKIVVGSRSRGRVDLDAPVGDNLAAIATSLGRGVEDLVVVVLDRPRHEKLIADIRRAGARIRLIADGDLSAGIAAAVSGTGVHAVMGIGGAPEGVLTAAAMRCLGGELQARLVASQPADVERLEASGLDPGRVYRAEDLAPGGRIVFAAAGVTDGTLLKGVRFSAGGTRTHGLAMTTAPRRIRFIETIDAGDDPAVPIRF